MVVGVSSDQKGPGFAACIVVALLLAASAASPIAVRGLVTLPVPEWTSLLGLWGATIVLGVRGVGGYLERSFRPEIVGLPYEYLSRRIYSPLCLVLAAMMSASALLP